MKNGFGIGAVVAVGAMLVGCAVENNYGLDVENHTGQTVLVEFLDVKSDGTTKVYSTAQLPSKGSFSNRMQSTAQGYGKRVRFSLPERPPEDLGARLELKLPDEDSRSYDLKVKNGRLMAEEYAKGRAPTASSGLTSGPGR